MFIVYPKNTPSAYEFQYTLDSSNILENIQGKVLLPVPKGVDPSKIRTLQDPTTWDPVSELASVLGHSYSQSKRYWVEKPNNRFYLNIGDEVTLTSLPVNTLTFAVCSLYGQVNTNFSSSSIGGDVSLQAPLTQPVAMYYRIKQQGVNSGNFQGWVPLSKSTIHSDPFSFVSNLVKIPDNPDLTGLEVKVTGVSKINLLSFGIMYNNV